MYWVTLYNSPEWVLGPKFQTLPCLILQTNPFRSEQSTSLQPPALEAELLATTHVFWVRKASGWLVAQFVYSVIEWSLHVNSGELASRERPSHKPPRKFFKLRTTNAVGKKYQNLKSKWNSSLPREMASENGKLTQPKDFLQSSCTLIIRKQYQVQQTFLHRTCSTSFPFLQMELLS